MKPQNHRRGLLVALFAGAVVLSGLCRRPAIPPGPPVIVDGPGSGGVNISYEFTAVAVCPGRGELALRFDWDDGDTSAWSGPAAGGDSVTMSHAWTEPGGYSVRAQARSAADAVSDWSEPHELVILLNQPPDTPARPSAGLPPIRGRPACFSSSATDPDGDSVALRFDWGDGDTSAWSGLVRSGNTVTIPYAWTESGTWLVRAQAQDEHGARSGWSEPLELDWRIDTSGVVVWAWVTPEDARPLGSALVLTVDGEERVYVGADDEEGRFYAIRVRDGRRVTSSSGMDRDWFTGHPAYVDATGNIVVGNEGGELFAFDPVNLATRWRWSSEPYVRAEWGVPAVSGNRVYVTRDRWRAGAPGVNALHHLTDLGADVRHEGDVAVPGIRGNPVITNAGHVAVVTDSGRLLVLNGVTLNPVRDTVLTTGNAALNSPVVGAAGHIYVGDVAGRVYCINPDFSVDWTAPVSGEANSIVLGDGAVFVATGTGRLYRLDARTGSVVWGITLEEENDVEVSPILTANGLIYVQDDMDILHCIRQADGACVWLLDLDDYARSGPARRRAPDFLNPEYSPGITSTGDIIVVGMHALYCVTGYPTGPLAPTAWPKWQGGMHNAGRSGGY